jgi:alpha-tubulin suppressor-like RCC1 family protein
VALRKDGTVVGVAIKGYESAVAGISEWKGVIAVAAGYAQTLALKADRTVVAAGGNWAGQCNVAGWRDVVGIAAGMHSVGVRQDGTCLAVGSNKYGQCNVADWKDIIAVAAGDAHTVGLKRDGTVVATGRNNMGQCNVGKWTDIVDVKSLSWQTIGLCKDGTVVTIGEDNWKQQTMNEAVKDAVAITSGEHFFVALRPDGTIFCAGEASRSRNAMNCNLGTTPPSAYQVRNRGKGSVK